jgi:membrane protein DedA with SNARE-associated domain
LHIISTTIFLHLLTSYGYLAILLVVAIESMGIPAPGETILLAASVTAGTTGALSLPLVIAAAASGAIMGDNLGYWIGYSGGTRLLRRYGHLIHFTEGKRKLGFYLFEKHGGKVVFLGRFVSVLRMWAAFLAGAHHMRWMRFLCYNALGGIIWATFYGSGGYLLGTQVYRLKGPLGLVTLLLGGLGLITMTLLLRKYERQWEAEAERAFPGPLDQYEGHLTKKETIQAEKQRLSSPLPAQNAVANVPHLRVWQEQNAPAAPEEVEVTSITLKMLSLATRRTSKDPHSTGQNKARLHPITLERFSAAQEQQKGPISQ